MLQRSHLVAIRVFLMWAAVAAPLATGGVQAQERRLPASANEVRLSYAPVVQRVAPAVVNVYAAKTVTVRNPLLDDPIFRRFFGVPGGPDGSEQQQRSLGSGVLIDAAGLVVTNNHVIEGADQVRFRLPTSANSRLRSFSRTLARTWRCCDSRGNTNGSRPSNSRIPTHYRSVTSCLP